MQLFRFFIIIGIPFFRFSVVLTNDDLLSKKQKKALQTLQLYYMRSNDEIAFLKTIEKILTQKNQLSIKMRDCEQFLFDEELNKYNDASKDIENLMDTLKENAYYDRIKIRLMRKENDPSVDTIITELAKEPVSITL